MGTGCSSWSGGIERVATWKRSANLSSAFAPRALSPDGSRVAVLGLENGNIDVWAHDIVRGLKTRVTSDPAGEERPNWLPSGDEISFSSSRNGTQDIFVKSADGRGEAEVLVATPTAEFPYDWTADGNYMIFVQFHAEGGGSLLLAT